MVQSSAIKHDFYSTYSTFTRLTYGPTDFRVPVLYELPVSHIRGCFEVNWIILMTSIYFC